MSVLSPMPVRVAARSLCLALALASVGCGAPRVSMRAMSAAAVDIPPEIQRVAVVDRSSAKNAGETALGILEGVVTGEAPLEDNEGRRLAVGALVDTLQAAPRFEVIRPTLTPKEADSSLMDKRWDYKSIVKLCEKHGCDAVIALETFDTDSDVVSGLIERAVTEAVTSSSASTSGGAGAAPSGSSSKESGSSGTRSDAADTESEGSPDPSRTASPGAPMATRDAGKVDAAPTTGGATRSASTTSDLSGGASRSPQPEPTESSPSDGGSGGTSAERSDPTPADTTSTEPPPTTHWATRTTRLNATWRMYSAKEDVILDEEKDRVMGSTSKAEGRSEAEALANLTTASAMISADGRELGSQYGARISPTWITLQRQYFASGALKMGKRYVLASDWDGAVEFWRTVVDDETQSAKVRGKARHNLAVAAERKGQLKKALKLAQKAAVETNSGVSQAYARALVRRIEEQERIAQQLAAPEVEK